MICAGIDAGSRAIKIALLDAANLEVIASGEADQGVDQDDLASKLYEEVLTSAGLSRTDVARTVATGYARGTVRQADLTITEISCHACGVHHLLPQAVTIVEIGGQDSKLIRLNGDGNVRDFDMNDRCAAGTGRFLEMVAERLDVPLAGLGGLAAGSRSPAVISSMCAVFAETEIISLLASGVQPPDIIAGVQASIASRISSMAGRNLALPIAFTGGVARISGMDAALASALRHPVAVAPRPEMTGALGAAVLAARQCSRPE